MEMCVSTVLKFLCSTEGIKNTHTIRIRQGTHVSRSVCCNCKSSNNPCEIEWFTAWTDWGLLHASCRMSDITLCKKKPTIHKVTTMLASEGSSVPVVSRWLWPRNRTFLEVASMVVTLSIVAFLQCNNVSWAACCWMTLRLNKDVQCHERHPSTLS